MSIRPNTDLRYKQAIWTSTVHVQIFLTVEEILGTYGSVTFDVRFQHCRSPYLLRHTYC